MHYCRLRRIAPPAAAHLAEHGTPDAGDDDDVHLAHSSGKFCSPPTISPVRNHIARQRLTRLNPELVSLQQRRRGVSDMRRADVVL